MKTVLFALVLALAMPIGAQEPMTYARLCGATEGTGDNNDFCALWAQNNWQGMRNALSISIRTARAAENRNRFYFDHKRGAERGAFIQLKRPWMDDDWQVRQYRTVDRDGDRFIEISMTDGEAELLLTLQELERWGHPEVGYARVHLRGYDRDSNPVISERWISATVGFPSDYVRRTVECSIDEYGWYMGVIGGQEDGLAVEVLPECDAISR